MFFFVLSTYFIFTDLTENVVLINIKNVKSMPRTSLAMAGKLFAAGNFSVVYMYTAEIYPTTIRFVSLSLFIIHISLSIFLFHLYSFSLLLCLQSSSIFLSSSLSYLSLILSNFSKLF